MHFALIGVLQAVSSAGLSLNGQNTPPILPDPKLTPGDALEVTREDICRPGYTRLVRDVPARVKKQVYAEYGIRHHRAREFEVDHLISLELGGSNSIKNLWPESYETQPWNAHVKDRLENALHREICSGTVEMKTAQQCIAKDWIACYKQTLPADSQRARHLPGSAAALRSGETSRVVWVNTRSGKYFLPGTRYYGATKEGMYLAEAEARERGFVRAK